MNITLLPRRFNVLKGYLQCKNINVQIIQRAYSNADEPIFDAENPFHKERKECILCKLKLNPDYKNVKLLSQFQSPYTGRIYGRHITGLCENKQKLVEAEICKAQKAGLMAVYLKEPCFLKDPTLFDPDKPIRPHRF